MTRIAALALTVLVVAACGGEDAPRARAMVPDGIVPESVPTGALALVPYDDPEVKDAFNPAGARSLADDARVWQVRREALLVGALEVVALGERADPANTDDLRSMVSQAIPGAPDRFDVEGVEIFAGRTGERELYCWFSNQLMVFLQLRSEGVDGELVVADLVRHQVTHDAWESLPPLSEEDL